MIATKQQQSFIDVQALYASGTEHAAANARKSRHRRTSSHATDIISSRADNIKNFAAQNRYCFKLPKSKAKAINYVFCFFLLRLCNVKY